MSLKSSENTKTNEYKLTTLVDHATFEKAIDKAYLRNRKKISVPGFRKGKAPRHYIEKIYGDNVFYDDAIQILYPDAVRTAVEESGLIPVDAPKEPSVNEISSEGVELSFTITVKPEVEIGEYKGLKATKEEVKVDDEDIENEVKNLQQRNARIMTAEDGHVIANNDIVAIDFEGFKDGVAFEGGKGENVELSIGSGQFIPGFEDQLIGHKLNEEFDINVTFPEDYNEESLKGQPAVFKIKVNAIKIKDLPEIDDEFAKDVSEFDTMDDLRKDIAKKIKEQKENIADNKFENKLLDQLLEGLKGEIPEVMYEHRIDENIQDFDYRLRMQGLNVNSYLQYTGMDSAEFRKGFKEQSERQVKVRLALEKVAKLENIVPTDDEIEEEIQRMVKLYNVEADKIKQTVSNEDISLDLAVKKALDLIKESAINE